MLERMFALIGFLAFALTTLYLEQDIAAPLQRFVSSRLARAGWVETVPGDRGSLGPRKRGGFARFVWSLAGCPYCLSTWVALLATWYVVGHPWHKAFWLAWWGAVGVAWLAIAMYKYHQDLVVEIGERREAAAHERWREQQHDDTA